MGQVITLNHNGKKGAVLSKKQYDLMKEFIISVFESRSQISFEYLVHIAQHNDRIQQNSNALWLLLKVKQDLQARGILKVRFVGFAPKIQMLFLNKSALKAWEESPLPSVIYS